MRMSPPSARALRSTAITLAPTVKTLSHAGYWNVVDAATTYEVIRSGSAIYVYTVVRP